LNKTITGKKADITEIFESIQGEGFLLGIPQLFIRFAKCNLSCSYCDTKTPANPKFCKTEGGKIENPLNIDFVNSLIGEHPKIHSICLTGGEPLLYPEFILALEKKAPLYLETNMTLPENADKIKRIVDFVAGDFKVKEVLDNYDTIRERTVKCFKVLKDSEERLTFAKFVLPKRFDSEEILNNALSIEKRVAGFVLQPIFGVKNIDNLLKLQKKMIDIGDVRIIPQMHKYLGVK